VASKDSAEYLEESCVMRKLNLIKADAVTKGTVGNKDISQEPEMQRLCEVFDSMTDDEKARTLAHVEEKAAELLELPNGKNV